MCPQLQLKKTKVRLLAVNIAAKGVLCTALQTRRNMFLATNMKHGHGPNNKMLHYLQPKKTKVRLLAVYMIAKGIISAVHY